DGKVKVEIPPTTMATGQRLQLEGATTFDEFGPAVAGHNLEVDPPSLNDLRPDWVRVGDALVASGISLPEPPLRIVRHVCDRMRGLSWKGRVVVAGERNRVGIVTVLPSSAPMLALAFDIGTTKIAGYLVDLDSGRTLARAGVVNPQIVFGEDVVSRIAHANRDPGSEALLRSRLLDALNDLARHLTVGYGDPSECIVDAVVVGNTAMHHFFAGLSVRQLGVAPYVPVTSSSHTEPAGELGLSFCPGASVYLPPNVAGYVGADHVSMLVAADILTRSGSVLALDIGTNTEISLKLGERLLSCSCASGPAFEGAHIRDGMRAVPGAVEHVRVSGDVFHVQTIESAPPVGICGSGILDAVAAMLEAGVVDKRGRFHGAHPSVRRRNGEPEFVLVAAETTGHGHDIVVTSRDVVEIQLAKGAIRAGIEILCRHAGIKSDELDTLVVAGAFGTYLDPSSAIRIGMFPSLPEHRIEQIGNAAGTGAVRMLRFGAERQTARSIGERSEYIELTTHPDFADVFTDELFFDAALGEESVTVAGSGGGSSNVTRNTPPSATNLR
ncbi:MAG: ASKHA domain-containing protein, partial [Rhodothermales bacterium]|nr:ASKHA domain-containing protein [Rhodothermales bacterium]